MTTEPCQDCGRPIGFGEGNFLDHIESIVCPDCLGKREPIGIVRGPGEPLEDGTPTVIVDVLPGLVPVGKQPAFVANVPGAYRDPFETNGRAMWELLKKLETTCDNEYGRYCPTCLVDAAGFAGTPPVHESDCEWLRIAQAVGER